MENTTGKVQLFEESQREGYFFRTFNERDKDKFEWHQDPEDRVVKHVNGDNWFIQLDNCDIQVIERGSKFFIPKNIYHRIGCLNNCDETLELSIEKL